MTRYGMDGSEFEPRWEKKFLFSTLAQLGSGTHSAFSMVGPRFTASQMATACHSNESSFVSLTTSHQCHSFEFNFLNVISLLSCLEFYNIFSVVNCLSVCSCSFLIKLYLLPYLLTYLLHGAESFLRS